MRQAGRRGLAIATRRSKKRKVESALKTGQTMPGTFRVRAREKYAPSKLLITFAHPKRARCVCVCVSEVLGIALEAVEIVPGSLSPARRCLELVAA